MSSPIAHGRLYDGQSALGTSVTLIASTRDICIVGMETIRRFERQQVTVSPRVGIGERFVLLPDGAQFQCKDGPLLDRLPAEVSSEGLVA